MFKRRLTSVWTSTKELVAWFTIIAPLAFCAWAAGFWLGRLLFWLLFVACGGLARLLAWSRLPESASTVAFVFGAVAGTLVCLLATEAMPWAWRRMIGRG